MASQQFSDPDMGSMAGYDPDLGLGNAGYAKATAQHITAMNDHLKSVGMNAQSPGAKQVVEGIHKAAMDKMFNTEPQNANSTAPMARGSSTGFMVSH